MPKKIKLYTLTAEDLKIFDRAYRFQKDLRGQIYRCGSFFTSFYFRTALQSSGWEFDKKIEPAWQLTFHHAEQTDICCIGGFGSGKTVVAAMSALTHGAILPWFKFLNTAPLAWQARQMFDAMAERFTGTLFEERFLPDYDVVQSPWPKITVKYQYPARTEAVLQGLSKEYLKLLDEWSVWGNRIENKFEFMSTEKNAAKIRTWEGDWVNIDQGEAVEDLAEAIINLGTRVRGSIRGRDRMGRLSITANADDNPELWDVFDLGKQYPETNLSLNPSSRHNKNITDKQLNAFKKRIKDPTKLDHYLDAKRSPGKGEEFSRELVDMCADTDLDQFIMSDHPSIQLIEASGAGITHWAMPYDETRTYLVGGDPGQGRPPHRNAPVVAVWDITDYGVAPSPLIAFWWGDGGGKYEPWIDQYLLWLKTYHCSGGFYEATAGQKVHSETTFKDHDMVVGVDLSGIKKKLNIVALKLMMQKRRTIWPSKIVGIRWQFLKYKLPDEKISQDIVSVYICLAGYMTMMGYGDEPPSEAQDEPDTAIDRYRRDVSDRHERASTR